MRITQGTFSFLPDFSDEQIEAQIRYALRNGWAISVEHTDDPHPRNVYWDLWGLPLFDLAEDECEKAMREVRACREAFADHYVKVLAYEVPCADHCKADLGARASRTVPADTIQGLSALSSCCSRMIAW